MSDKKCYHKNKRLTGSLYLECSNCRKYLRRWWIENLPQEVTTKILEIVKDYNYSGKKRGKATE